MEIYPLNDRVAVRRLDPITATPSGIVQGTVVATGPGKVVATGKRVLVELLLGDTVLFGKFAGSTVTVTVDGEDLLILREDEILAVVR